MRWRTWLWARLLLTIDRLLGTRLLDRELARRQLRIEGLVTQLTTVNRELDLLAERVAFSRLMLCLVHLKARSEQDDVEDWLYFGPCDAEGEALLDQAVEFLVKPGLADIDVEPGESGGYAYRLRPDWQRLLEHLQGNALAPEMRTWLQAQR